MDYGIEGLSGTLSALNAAGISHAGAGMSLGEAFRPALLAPGASRIAVFSEGVDNDETAFASVERPGIAPIAVRALRQGIAGVRSASTVVVVMLHWGIEYQTMYAPAQRALAHALVDAGADLVVGTGPHVLQGIERYGGALICYSLGNLVFDDLRSADTSAGLLLRMRVLSVHGSVTRKVFSIAPLRTKQKSEGPRAPTLEDAEGIIRMIAARSPEPSVVDHSGPIAEDGLSWFEIR
jgi:poly-gamma-glutamate synthesis protein (capsule biosynthesis protein)